MNDDARADLLDRLAALKFAGTPAELREDLLHFYADPSAPYATKRNGKAWAKLQAQLEQLKAAAPGPAAAGAPAREPRNLPPLL
jgi:hypothetical protein